MRNYKIIKVIYVDINERKIGDKPTRIITKITGEQAKEILKKYGYNLRNVGSHLQFVKGATDKRGLKYSLYMQPIKN